MLAYYFRYIQNVLSPTSKYQNEKNWQEKVLDFIQSSVESNVCWTRMCHIVSLHVKYVTQFDDGNVSKTTITITTNNKNSNKKNFLCKFNNPVDKLLFCHPVIADE